MNGQRAYLDHNASSPLRESARSAVANALSLCGNASSVHGEGRALRKLVEVARAQVADLVGVDADSVIFTSSATEAANLALTPDIRSDGRPRPAGHLYVLATEHPCVLSGGRFSEENVSQIPVLENGIIDAPALDDLLAHHDGSTGTAYVAIQLVNSETGVVQPVADIARSVRMRGGYVLCDTVQAAGRLPIDATELGVDFLILSAHKIGGPQGAGALINVHSVLDVMPAIRGGAQEKNRRAGTENVAAIAGFGAAADEARTQVSQFNKISALKDSIEDQLLPICQSNGMAERLVVFGKNADRVGNTVSFSVRGLNAETAVIAFDLDGVSISSGSACSSGKVGRSHVLAAMGLDEDTARGAIRVSLGWNSTRADVEKFISAFGRITKRLGEMVTTELSGAA